MAWKIYVGTALNFFLLGPGYLLFTDRKVLGAFLTLGALGSTYVEQVQLAAMEDQTPFMVMFVSFFCLAIGCAVDGYQEIKKAVEAG